MLEKNGYQEVATYINNGNAIFKSKVNDSRILQKEIEAIIKQEFKLDIAVAVFTSKEVVEG